MAFDTAWAETLWPRAAVEMLPCSYTVTKYLTWLMFMSGVPQLVRDRGIEPNDTPSWRKRVLFRDA